MSFLKRKRRTLLEMILLFFISTQITPVKSVFASPDIPPESVCLASRTSMVTCTFYSRSHGKIELCWEIANTNRYVWHNGCENNVQNVSFTFILEEPGLLLTTTVSNDFGRSTRTDHHRPFVQPDPPTIATLFSTDIDTFNASFKIPSTWKINSWLNYKGNYTQNGIENTLPMAFCKGKTEVLLSFVVQRLSYSLVCLTIQLQYGILGPYLDVDSFLWSNSSEQVCSYTPMAAPSKSPRIVKVSVTRSQSNSELRNVTLRWEMNHYMSKKRPEFSQKEIFDDLKLRMATYVIDTQHDYHHGRVKSLSCNDLKSASIEKLNGFISASDDTKNNTTSSLSVPYASSEGASLYIISTVAEGSSLTGNLGENCDVNSTNEYSHTRKTNGNITEKPSSAKRGDYIPRNDIVEYCNIQGTPEGNENRQIITHARNLQTKVSVDNEYESIGSRKRFRSSSVGSTLGSMEDHIDTTGVPISSSETFLPYTNSVMNMEYYLVSNTTQGERPYYANYVPFEVRVHNTMSTLNAMSLNE